MNRFAEDSTSRVRWSILAMLFGFSFVSYLERVNISITAEMMMPELSLTKTAMGQIFSSFLIGYAIFQIPGGALGDTIGPRLTLSLAALFWGIVTVLSGIIPGAIVQGSTSVFVSLWILRFLLGSTEAATYPVAALSVRNWMPARQRAFANGVMLSGSSLATAVTAPVVSLLMIRFGWRDAFYVTSSLAFLIAVLWFRYATDRPEQHPHISANELALIRPQQESTSVPPESNGGIRRVWELLANRKILFLSLSYISEGYVLFIFVFWLYIYLVEVRGFTLMKGGLVTSLPWLAATLATPAGGYVSDLLSSRFGRLEGARRIIMTSYGILGIMLFAAAEVGSRNLAVSILCLSVGFLYFAESSFWTTAAHLSTQNVGAVSGIMNAAGIVGGIASTSLVPILVKYFGWLVALGSGALMAILCALSWWAMGRIVAPDAPGPPQAASA